MNGEWVKLRAASSLIASNVSIAEPLFHHDTSMGRCVDRVNNFLTFAPEEQPILPIPYNYISIADASIKMGYPAGVILL